MTKKKILIASLRNNVKYTKPLQMVADNIYYCLDRYISGEGSAKYEFSYFKTSFNGRKPPTDIDVAKDCDVIVVPSISEFTYHIPNFRHQYDQKKSDDLVESLGKNLSGKGFMLISHEQADTLDVFTDRTFKGVKFSHANEIHQEDMGNEFMHMRYDFIRNEILDGRSSSLFEQAYSSKVPFDFAYWGCSKTKTIGGVKSGDMRQKYLTEIWKQAPKRGIKTFFQGKYDKIKKDASWTNDFSTIIPTIQNSHATLCFQWPGKEHLPTTRYPEALACGIIPLVWGDFDRGGRIYNHLKWQEVSSVEEVLEKVDHLKSHPVFANDVYHDILDAFNSRAGKKTLDENYTDFVKTFERKLAEHF